MTISELLLPEFDDEMAKTRKLLEQVPFGDADWKPHEKSMSLGRLAGHVAEIPIWASRTLRTDSFNAQPGPNPFIARSTTEVVVAFDKNVAEARSALAAVTDEQMQQIWTLSFQGRTVFSAPRHRALRQMALNHLFHHRGQLSVYLRLNEVPVPGMYGPSADEMKAMQAGQLAST